MKKYFIFSLFVSLNSYSQNEEGIGPFIIGKSSISIAHNLPINNYNPSHAPTVSLSIFLSVIL